MVWRDWSISRVGGWRVLKVALLGVIVLKIHSLGFASRTRSLNFIS